MKHELLQAVSLSITIMLLGCANRQLDTRYEFRFEDKSGRLIRLNHSTGEATIADGEGTQQLLPPNDNPQLNVLTADQLSKVTGNAGCSQSDQLFRGRLYNGSDVVLRTVGISITHKKAFSEELAWKRQFVIRDLYVRPLEVRTFVVPLTGLEGSVCDWATTHAYGSPWRPDATWWDRLTQ